MDQKKADMILLFVATAAAAVLGTIGFSTAPPHWRIMAAISPILAVSLLFKLFRPDHVIYSKVSWAYLLLTVSLLELAAFFGGNHAILGYWTVPSLIGLGFLYCLVHMSLGPGDDGPPVKR